MCNKPFRLCNPFRSAVLVDIMQPCSDDGDVCPTKHPHQSGNPGRVDNIGGSPVLAELPLMGTGGMIGSILDRQ